MHLEFFAFYAGPDQVMTVTSALASLLGLLLIFWNKVVGSFFKIVGVFRPKNHPIPATSSSTTEPSKNTR